MSLVTKQRFLGKTRSCHVERWIDYNTRTNLLEPYDIKITQPQITMTEGHRWPQDRGVRDAGGPFDTIKLTYWNSHDLARVHGGYNAGWWNSFSDSNAIPFIQEIPTAFQYEEFTDAHKYYIYDWVPVSGNLDAIGTKLIAGALPTNPVLDGSVSLAELFREGLPAMFGASLLRDRVGFFRGLGSEYLNYEFGWKPLVSDIQAAAKAITDSKSIMDNLAKHSGKDLKRVRILPVERGVSVDNRTDIYPCGLDSSFYNGPSWYRTTTTTYRRQWFSGCFTYHYDPGQMTEIEKIVTQARLLLGIELTPETLWNLAPWSWLVDWVFNVGDILKNVTAFQQDGLVMKYGYVMEYNSKTFVRKNLAMDCKIGAPAETHDVFRGERKIRAKASPFGFGIADTSFTERQWSILGALGLTRGPKSL